MSYAAYFAAGSDPEFSVSPSTGELLPVGTNGSMIRISFLPSVYGKIYTGKLIIQVSEWLHFKATVFKIIIFGGTIL